MGTALVRQVAPKKEGVTSKPPAQTWRNRLKKPWSDHCDARAVVAVVLRLHELEQKRCFSIEQVVAFVIGGDLGCLPSLRRADVIEAFYDRHDVAALVHILVAYLVSEGVLIPECVYEGEGEKYRMNREELPTLNNFHVHLGRDGNKTKPAKLRVV